MMTATGFFLLVVGWSLAQFVGRPNEAKAYPAEIAAGGIVAAGVMLTFFGIIEFLWDTMP